MKIKLTRTLPVAKEHGCQEGRVFKVEEEVESARRHDVKWWIHSDAGQRVGVLKTEAVPVD